MSLTALTRLSLIRRPSRTSAHDGVEIVVEQDERGGFTRDVGPALTHRDADVGRLQRGAIVRARHRSWRRPRRELQAETIRSFFRA